VQDFAVLTDVERPARRETEAPQDAVGGRNILRRVRQNRIVGFDMLGEFLVLLRAVDADREVGDLELPDGLTALTERLAFGRSTASEGFGEPGEDDRAVPFEVGQQVPLAV
jgi:hypothetical protein